MQKIVHRVNTIEKLKTVSPEYGVEVDIRGFGTDLVLNHEPLQTGELLEEYMKHYHHQIIILNIKEAGIEDKVIEIMKRFQVSTYFLLDVEFPYIYRSTRQGNRNIAIRYSEDEPLEQALLYKDKVDYIFIDTNTRLPIDGEFASKIGGLQTCLVSPDRWGRPQDIPVYKKLMEEIGFKLDYVMVGQDVAHLWD